MKTIVYLRLVGILLGLITQIGFAQQVSSSYWKTAFKKGTEQITLSYGYGSGYLVQNRSVTKLQAGYYVANRLLVGVGSSLAREWLGEAHTEGQFSVGPLVRYQITSSRLSPFAEVTYQFGRPTPAHNQAAMFTSGINFGLLPQIRLEADYCFVLLHEGIGQLQIGATILLGTKR